MLESLFFVPKGNNIRRALLQRQKGFIVSIDSVLNLYNDLQKLCNVKYILTSRLNQDALESFFSRIRAFGGPNTNPTPPEFRYLLRLLLVGSQIRGPTGTNTEDDNCSIISAKLISQNNLWRCKSNVHFPKETLTAGDVQHATSDAS